MPPMDIIVKWRPFSERLSSYLGTDCLLKFGWVIGLPFVNSGACYLGSTLTRGSPSFGTDLASYVTGTNLSVDGGNDATAGPYP
jgi:hypothetical protein